MELQGIIITIMGFLISIIGYFLKRQMEKIDKMDETLIRTKSKLDLVENDYINKHNHLSEKMDELYGALKELSSEIKQLTKELRK
jgi:SMC interacting uncharacterized protein involved in chromosome segregation